MIHTSQFKDLIQRTLAEMDGASDGKIKYSEEAVDLLMVTAAHESHLGHYLKQIQGPALGVFQMEPLTYEDHWLYVESKRRLRLMMMDMNFTLHKAEDMEWNLRYAIVMARVHYFRKPEPIPWKPRLFNEVSNENYLRNLSTYAKEHYNTYLGKATPEEYYDDYIKYCVTKA